MRGGWTASVLVLVSLGPVGVASAERHDGPVTGHDKAAFAWQLALFVGWPEAAFPRADSPFVFCVAGDDGIGSALEGMAARAQIRDRHVQIRRLEVDGDYLGCHMTWLTAAAMGTVEPVLARVRSRPILTISDVPGAAGRGVHFALATRDRRIVFDVNLAEARRSGLKLSARLLRLARSVIPARKDRVP